jgi:hypothetical protein
MKAGDILFVRGEGIVSNLVRMFDKGEFSHTAIALSNDHILEAQYYTRSRITKIYFDDYEIVDLGLTDEQRNESLKIAIDLTGEGYDYLQILGYLIKEKFNNPNNFICSEIVVKFLFQLGLVDDLDKYKYLKPNELYRKLKGVI